MRYLTIALMLFLFGCGDGPTTKGKFVPQNNTTPSNNMSTNNSTTPVNSSTPANNGACGNGTLDAGETCDPGIAGGEGACVTTCSSRACTTARLIGSADACTLECVVEPVGCVDADGCCTDGCTFENDSDCSENGPVCGNGTVEAGELCDGNCPTTCPAGPSACQPNVLTGSANACDAQCLPSTITTCIGGDGCCPAGCTNANDSDCMANCVPDTCDALGADCGNPPDGCGGRLSCGNCALGSCTDTYVCSNIGEPCTSPSDCVAGDLEPLCFTNEPNGYCSATCNDNNNLICPGTAFCDGDSIFQDNACSAPCTSNADCRTGYECRELQTGQPDTRTCLPSS